MVAYATQLASQSIMDHTIQPANTNDVKNIEALLPRLADFDVPANRNPDDLWQGDAQMLRDWAAGSRSDVEVLIAKASGKIVGVAIISFRKELLSGEPSAHLEVLALDKSAEGFGIATSLMQHSEELAKANGALSMSLHVFANNSRARALYERQGFNGELLRYSKPFV